MHALAIDAASAIYRAQGQDARYCSRFPGLASVSVISGRRSMEVLTRLVSIHWTS
jgi:hypothetical protein